MAATGPSSPDTPKTSSKDSSSSKGVFESANQSAIAATITADTDSIEQASDLDVPIAHHDNDNNNSHSKSISMMPTYHSTKQSKAYTLAEQLLKAGSFDDALTTLEIALQFTREMISNLMEGDQYDETSIELHESLAPLYYMYGTTLLYSVEESDVMMTADAGTSQQKEGGGQDYFEVMPEEQDEEQDEDENPELEEESEEKENEFADAEDPVTALTAGDPAEDSQIAWENLDLARSIVSKLVETFSNSYNNSSDCGTKIILKSDTPNSHSHGGYDLEQQRELLLDLSQIHTRLGDIQRSNDNLLSCLDDYHHALTLRLETLGKFHRKVADSHFSLAEVYAQAPNQMCETESRVNNFVNSLGIGAIGEVNENVEGKDGNEELTEDEKAEFRHRSLEHYLACGVAFAGILAKMCGVEPEKLTAVDTTFPISTSGMTSSGKMAATSNATSNSFLVYTQAMSTLRQRIQTLAQSGSTIVLSHEDREQYHNLQEMLDEIQEAMDSAKETEVGLKTLSEMKANEIKKHEMKVNDEHDGNGNALRGDGEGTTTTIGFNFTESASIAATSAITSSTEPTMLVVKKKKKPQTVQAERMEKEDASNKRAKSGDHNNMFSASK